MDARTLDLAKTGGILLLMTLAYLFFVHRPNVGELRRIESQISSANHEMLHIPVRLAEIEHLQDEVKEARQTLTQQPSVAETTTLLLSEISRLVQTQRMSVQRIDPLELPDQETHQWAAVRVELTGEYSQWHMLLKSLDDSSDEWEILSLSLQLSGTKSARTTPYRQTSLPNTDKARLQPIHFNASHAGVGIPHQPVNMETTKNVQEEYLPITGEIRIGRRLSPQLNLPKPEKSPASGN